MLKKTMVLGVIFVLALFFGLTNYTYAEEKGLVGLWKFDEIKGDIIKDSSGNGNDGTIYGAEAIGGKVGQALSFDGDDDYVDCGNDESLKPGKVATMEFWAKPFAYATSSRWHILGFNREDGYAFWQYYGDPGHKAWVIELNKIDGNRRKSTIVPLNTLFINAWTHVVLIFDGENGVLRCYINGTLLKETKIDVGDIVYEGNFYIGKGFNGCIDEVKIYNRVLSIQEIENK